MVILTEDVQSFPPARVTVFSGASLINVNGQTAQVSRRAGQLNCLMRKIE
jgi:hypothetical protein